MKKCIENWDITLVVVSLILFVFFIDQSKLFASISLMFLLIFQSIAVRKVSLNWLHYSIYFALYSWFSLASVFLVLPKNVSNKDNFWAAFIFIFLMLVQYGSVKFLNKSLSNLATILIYLSNILFTFGYIYDERIEIMPVMLGMIIAGITIIDNVFELIEDKK